jgi:hypothetical protein
MTAPQAISTASAPLGNGQEAASPAVPESICGYVIKESLVSSQADEPDFLGVSYLAGGPGGRGVVLKPLDPDCLLKNGLHPSIKERLARVRELAMGGVANLYGVERDPDRAGAKKSADSPNGHAWLIWEHVRGRTLDAYAADPACTTRKLALVARELVLVVEAMHRQGIVHGAIRPSNVIVDARNCVRLTHVSPLLYTDPGDDVWGLLHTLETVAAARGEEESPLGKLVAETLASLEPSAGPAPAPDAVLRIFAAKLGSIIESRERADLVPREEQGAELSPRRRSLAGAVVVLLLGIAVAFGIGWILRQPVNPVPQWIQSIKALFQSGK